MADFSAEKSERKFHPRTRPTKLCRPIYRGNKLALTHATFSTVKFMSADVFCVANKSDRQKHITSADVSTKPLNHKINVGTIQQWDRKHFILYM